MLQNFTKRQKQYGFTLVELLVVIAIIGLLSTIVLVSFGPVRTQARDTAVKANMSQMRLAAEIKYNADSTYMTTTTRDDYIAAKAAATAAAASTPNWVESFQADKYCIQVDLASGGKWCIDSIGSIGSTNVSCDTTADSRDCATD